MKGQKSLEMIIGLVMLLVVASVTISMFLNVFQEPELGDDTVEKQQIQNECSTKCTQFKEASGRSQLSAALDYCTSKFTRDITGDGTTSGVAGAGYNSYCEDGIKCFNVHTCETGIEETLDAERCRQLMCEYYTDVNNDPYDPEEEDNVQEHIQDIMSPQNEETGVGTCGLQNVEDSAGYELSTWYDPRGAEYSFSGGENGLSCEEEFKRFVDDEPEENTDDDDSGSDSEDNSGSTDVTADEICQEVWESDASSPECVEEGEAGFPVTTGGDSRVSEVCGQNQEVSCQEPELTS